MGGSLFSFLTPNGYAFRRRWCRWTNVGVNDDANGTAAVRFLTPAESWVSDSTISALPPWPYFHERQGLGLGAWSNTESSGDWVFPNFPGGVKVRGAPGWLGLAFSSQAVYLRPYCCHRPSRSRGTGSTPSRSTTRTASPGGRSGMCGST